MPIVPVLNTPDVTPRPITPQRVTPDEVGGIPNVPDSSRLADTVTQIWQEQKRKSDQVAVMGAAADVSNLETTLSTQTRQKLGINAYSAPDDVAKAWTAGVSTIGKGLTNDDQKLAFANVVQSHWNSLNETVQNHVAQQHKVVDAQNTDAYTSAEANAALEHYMDPLRVSEAVGNSAAALRAYGERNGQDPEYTAAHVAENTSKIHVGVIDRMLANGEDISARKYYDTVKDQIEGSQLPEVDKALKLGSSRAEGQRQAVQIMATTTTRADALDAVDKITDQNVQDQARTRVERAWAQKDDNAREVEADRVQQATDIVSQSHDFDRIPPTLLVGMKAANIKGLKDLAESFQKQTPVTSDMKTWLTLDAGLANPKTQKTTLDDMRENSGKYLGLLDAADYKSLYDKADKLRNGTGDIQQKLADEDRTRAVMTRTLTQIGFGVDPKKKIAEEPQMATAYREMTDAVKQQEKNTGKPVPIEDQETIANRIVTSYVVSRAGKQTTDTKRLFQLDPDEGIVIRGEDVSGKNRVTIIRNLRAQGLPVTEDAILQQYNAYVNSLVRRAPQ